MINACGSDFFENSAKCGKVLLLAPSSYLGGIYIPLIVAALGKAMPALQLVAVDDVWSARQSAANGFTQIISTAQFKNEKRWSGLPVVNCAYSLPTWLAFQAMAASVQAQHYDLPELLYLLELPLVYQKGSVTRTETQEHRHKFEMLGERFADAPSRKTLSAILNFRMDGNRTALLDVLCLGEQEYFSLYRGSEHPVELSEAEHYVDVGSYDGDTVRKFMAAARNKYLSIHAFEPDPANFQAMKLSLSDDESRSLILHNEAVSDSDGFLLFAAKGTMGSRADRNGNVQVPCVRLDDVLETITLLKMDVEGHEASVLRGAAKLIKRCRPRMAITCYHHALDLLDIVEVIDQILPGAQLRLRHYSMFFYDTILYVEWPEASA